MGWGEVWITQSLKSFGEIFVGGGGGGAKPLGGGAVLNRAPRLDQFGTMPVFLHPVSLNLINPYRPMAP